LCINYEMVMTKFAPSWTALNKREVDIMFSKFGQDLKQSASMMLATPTC
jgi:hypothetical protein